jgi:hypothetical protein
VGDAFHRLLKHSERGAFRVELAFRPASKPFIFCHPDEAFRPRRDLLLRFPAACEGVLHPMLDYS